MDKKSKQIGIDLYNLAITNETACTLSTQCGGSDSTGWQILMLNEMQAQETGEPYTIGHDIRTSGSIVRRLTPLECERLQGFPDGWTEIGEWTDTKGKKRKTTDTARYKALGNSIALPFWQWLAYRIKDQLKEDGVDTPTLASLFDGIGGFPLVFSRAGCVPVWASEIEEFPIAVTKKHFPETEQSEVKEQ